MILSKEFAKKLPKETDKPKIIVILGPTASGKSDLAVLLARKFNGEVISADSRQVYRGLDIGSGKIRKSEMRGVFHHLLSVSSPKNIFTAEKFRRLGKIAIKNILAEGKIPIIAGGTGLYIDSLIYDLNFPKVPPHMGLRTRLERLSTDKLFVKLVKLDKTFAKRIDRHNRRRLIRAIEIVETTGKPIPAITRSSPYEVLKIGISIAPQRLRENIRKRLDKRMRIGMVKEVKNLHKNGLSWKRLDDLGLEYRYISRYLRGLINLESMKEKIIHESYQYSKRQRQWWKKDIEINWINNSKSAKRITRRFIR